MVFNPPYVSARELIKTGHNLHRIQKKWLSLLPQSLRKILIPYVGIGGPIREGRHLQIRLDRHQLDYLPLRSRVLRTFTIVTLEGLQALTRTGRQG